MSMTVRVVDSIDMVLCKADIHDDHFFELARRGKIYTTMIILKSGVLHAPTIKVDDFINAIKEMAS
jgi:hypothetical protein